MKSRVFLLLALSLLLSACGGGGDGDSPDGGSAPVTAEVQAPQARDSYDQLLTANQPNANNIVSLSDRVSDPQGLPLRLMTVQPLSSQCKAPVIDSDALSFRVDNASADACTYAYTVQNVPTNGASPKQTQATSYVVVSATSAPAMLPIISQTAMVNETITVDLVQALGGNFPIGFTLQPEVIVLGSGTAYADQGNDQIVYTAAAVPGITRLLYSYVSSDGSEVRAGSIDVSVSKSADGMPQAENFPGPEDVLPGAVVTVDVKDHISDPNGDVLQLTDAYAFDATVGATSKNDIANTKFDFVAEKPGVYDVTYYVTDHNGGYAIAVVRITVKADQLWSDIVLSDGSRYTAPWEKNLADGLGVPYQDYYEEVNANGRYDVALFNYNAALTLCAARGMTLPSLADMNKLHGERPDPSSSDNWPVERPYWVSEELDENGDAQVYDLLSGSATASAIATPQGVTCVYSGILANLDTVVDNQYVNSSPATAKQDEVEALVTTADGTPAANRNVYFYSSNPDLLFSQKQVATDANGKAKVKVESGVAGTFTVYANFLTQTLDTAVTFIDNLISDLVITGNSEVRMGESINLTASATYDSGDVIDVSSEADWSSSEPAVATVGGGVVTGIAPGVVDINASTAGANALPHSVTVFAGPTSLVVTPASALLQPTETQLLNAVVDFDDGNSLDVTGSAIWSSSNAAIASVDNNGLVTAVSSGAADIKATYTDHGIVQEGIAKITVGKIVDHTAVTPSSMTFKMGDPGKYIYNYVYYTDGTNQNVTSPTVWTSSDANVAIVSSQDLVIPKGPGSATITGKYTENGVTYTSTMPVTVTGKAVSNITVDPTTVSLAKGATKALAVTAHYSDGTSEVVTSSSSYSSSNTGVATVNSAGLITAVNAGSATVTSSYQGKTATTSVTVTATPTKALDHITVTPSLYYLGLGQKATLTTKAYYTDGTNKTVTGSYTSNNTAVATVSGNTVTAQDYGTAIITSTYSEGGVTKTATVALYVQAHYTLVDQYWADANGNKVDSYTTTVGGTVRTYFYNEYADGTSGLIENVCYGGMSCETTSNGHFTMSGSTITGVSVGTGTIIGKISSYPNYGHKITVYVN